MIRYFKKIKRRLLAENKISRYLAYAIGEIVLIVIGILIALYINNWNIHRQNKEKEQFYLSGLLDEFQSNKVKLQNLIEVNRSTLEESRQIAEISYGESTPDEQELSNRLFKAFSYEIDYNPTNSLLNEIISSGGMKNFADAELRMHLTAWDSRIQSVHRQEQTLRSQREKLIELTADEGGSIRTIFDNSGISERLNLQSEKKNESNLQLVKSKAFENALLLFILTADITEEVHYTNLLNEIETILQLIEKSQKN